MSGYAKRFLGILPLVLLVIFVMLPSVSRTIFSSWDCVPYDAGIEGTTSYLRRDHSVECGSDEHKNVVAVAIPLVILWPVCMQMLFWCVLFCNRETLRSGDDNSVSRALRFLTGGYKAKYFYWEVIELSRRLTCSGFVVLIPEKYIFFRIIMAMMVSVPVLVMTAYLEPFRNPEDTTLSLMAQTILVLAYCCCALLRVVTEERLEEGLKRRILGFASGDGLFLVVGLCCIVFLVFLIGSYVYKVNDEFQKRLRRVSSEDALESSRWLLTGAFVCGFVAMALGGLFYGMTGAILAAAIFFTVGGALGSVLYTWCIEPKKSRCTTTTSTWDDTPPERKKSALAGVKLPEESATSTPSVQPGSSSVL